LRRKHRNLLRDLSQLRAAVCRRERRILWCLTHSIVQSQLEGL
jgi:hypothetical protein